MGIRLNKVITELNIGLQTAIDFLRNSHIGELKVGANPATKITDDQYRALVKEFRSDKDVKTYADMSRAKNDDKEIKKKKKKNQRLIQIGLEMRHKWDTERKQKQRKPKRIRYKRGDISENQTIITNKSVASLTHIKNKLDVDDAINCFVWPNLKYKREDDYYVQKLIGNNVELMSYYHHKMKSYFGIEHVLRNEYVIKKSPVQIESKDKEKAIYDKSDSLGYKIYKIEQPVASLLVTGQIKVIQLDSESNLSYGETIIIYALPETDESTDLLWSNDSLYSIYHNSLYMGNIVDEGLPVNAFIGYVKVGKKTKNGFYGIVSNGCFLKPLNKITHNLVYYVLNNKKPERIILENRSIKVPLCDMAWDDLCHLSNSVYFYWKQSFDNFYSAEYGFGDEKGPYEIVFYNKKEEKHCLQDDKDVIKKERYISEPDMKEFDALVFDFEKISFKPKYESSFNALKKREWNLDWKCVNFRNGYFVVSPPAYGIIKFNPLAVSYPGVLESFNYLKEYLNDRLATVRCSVEEMKLTIYDRIRLEEAIEKFTKASKQRAIKTSGTATANKIVPQQMSFKQALSKAQQMTPEEFKKYKSEYIDFLVKMQSKEYKVIPCVERLAHSTGDMTEYAFIFSLKCGNGNIMIVHENVNPDRSTLIFEVKSATYNNSIRAIYDFLQSAEINKRSNLRDRNVEIEEAGIVRYRSINHENINQWQRVIKSCVLYNWTMNVY